MSDCFYCGEKKAEYNYKGRPYCGAKTCLDNFIRRNREKVKDIIRETTREY